MSEMIATRQAFGDALYKAMQSDERIMALTADLGESLRLLKIRDEMPSRFIDTGVAEANMVGIAAGLALQGFVPVAGTFAVFMTRAYDHIRLQICQNNVHAILVGSHGGVSNAMDGGSAHALEDLAYMRALPNMTVLFPGDANEMTAALPVAIAHTGPVYLRLYREPTAVFTDASRPFQIGQAYVVRPGTDITLFGTGPQTATALAAAEKLAADNISAEVVAVPTLQPIDRASIIESISKTGHAVTIEDHNINGGLGSTIAEILSEEHPTPLLRIGVRQFGESGSYAELITKLGLDPESVAQAARAFLNK